MGNCLIKKHRDGKANFLCWSVFVNGGQGTQYTAWDSGILISKGKMIGMVCDQDKTTYNYTYGIWVSTDNNDWREFYRTSGYVDGFTYVDNIENARYYRVEAGGNGSKRVTGSFMIMY